ncbi:BTAD domain-containing putative transcriptional regulator [Arthrobacter cupressi]
MEFRILGPMEVREGTRRLDVPGGRARALLAMLVLHAGDAVPSERLVDELWGEQPPPTANTVVQMHVLKLRKLLEPDREALGHPTLLVTQGSGYRLAISPGDVDAGRFKQLLDQAAGQPAEPRSRLLTEALALWRGPALADFAFHPFAQGTITALEELRLSALEARIEADLELGRNHGLVAELDLLVAEHPFRERLSGLLMLALYRAGRQADAIAAYRDARNRLVDELGVEPGPGLREIEAAVLRQDPSLGERSPTRVVTEGWLPRERRMVTVVGLEIVPASDDDADAEALAAAGTRANEVAVAVLRTHGARVEQVVGGLMVAFFGFPVAHEDDAVRAVRAAVEVCDRLATVDEPVVRHAARAVVETGDIVVSGSGGSLADMVSGPAVTSAFRLQRLVRDSDVVVGPRTLQLVRGAAVVVSVPGETAAWRVIGMMDDSRGRLRFDSTTVGRAEELVRIRTAFRAAGRAGVPGRFTVVGEAGVGKTRLAADFADSVDGEALVAWGRCASYGEGITFLPLREALLDAAGERGWPALAELVPEDAAVVAAGLGLAEGTETVPAMLRATVRLLEALSARQPLLLVLDDLHWAEPTLLDLVDQAVGSGKGRLFVLCLGRPELLDQRPEWTDALVLEPLPADDVAALLRGRAPGIDVEAVTAIVDRARGNPLFAEQLLAAHEEADLDALPDSLRALLAARLDRLGPGERDLLRVAAVAGDDCGRDALAALLPDGARAYIERHLSTLKARRLLTGGSNGVVRFGHVLIRLAAYRSMTHPDRAALHRRYAEWLLDGAHEQPPELDEIVGYHLEHAVLSLRAIGAGDESLAARAGAHLSRAGERAAARSDQTAARNLLSRARAMMAGDDSASGTLTQRLAEVDLVLGRFPEAQQLLLELAQRSAAAGNDVAARAALLEHARIQFIVGPDPVPLSSIGREAAEAESFFTAHNDDGGRCRAIFLQACVRVRQGRLTEAERAFRANIELADRAKSVREQMANRWLLAEALAAGPVPVRQCLPEIEAIALPGVEHPGLLIHAGWLHAMERRFDEGRELFDRAQRAVQETLHAPRLLMFVAAVRGTAELLAGNFPAAEAALRTQLDAARRTGERQNLPTSAARLSLLLHEMGRPEEAAELAALAAATAPAEGVEARALSAAASAMASRDPDKALVLALEALRWAPAEMLNLRGDVHRTVAGVCFARGDRARGDAAVAEAARCYRAKGNLAAMAHLH